MKIEMNPIFFCLDKLFHILLPHPVQRYQQWGESKTIPPSSFYVKINFIIAIRYPKSVAVLAQTLTNINLLFSAEFLDLYTLTLA